MSVAGLAAVVNLPQGVVRFVCLLRACFCGPISRRDEVPIQHHWTTGVLVGQGADGLCEPHWAWLADPVLWTVGQYVASDIKGSDPFGLCIFPHRAEAAQGRSRGLVLLLIIGPELPLLP